MKKNTIRVKYFSFVAALLLLLTAVMPAARAAGEFFYLRSYDLGGLSQGKMTVSLTTSALISQENLGFTVGGIKTKCEPSKIADDEFRYILIVDESQPYYRQRENDHPSVVVSAVNNVLNTANGRAQFAFVWAGSNNAQTRFLSRDAAYAEAEKQLSAIDINYRQKIDAVDLKEAFAAAIGMAADTKMVTSIILISDCCADCPDYSQAMQQNGIILHVFALHASKSDTEPSNKGKDAAAAGRKNFQTMSTKTGGQFAQWDISEAPRNNAYEYVNLGSVADAIKSDRGNTLKYTLTIPEKDYEAARASKDQKIQALYNGNVVAQRVAGDLSFGALPSPTPQPTASPTPALKTIRFGDQNQPEIVQMQQTLHRLGYYDGAIDGIYDQKTRDAYRDLWESNNGKPKETYDVWTVDVLDTLMLYKPKVTPPPAVIDLHQGDTSSYVVQLQNALSGLGYYHRLRRNDGGVFDEDTQTAITRFCNQNSIAAPEEGCSVELCNIILSSRIQYIHPQYVDLHPDESDAGGDTYVANLQLTLLGKGYLQSGYNKGTLDSMTMDAVRAICEDNGWPMSADVVSVETQNRIETADVRRTATPAPTQTPKPDVIALHLGDTGEYVEKLQMQLHRHGFFYGLVNNAGTFDNDTQEAVWRFCSQINAVRPASGCDESTFRLIMASDNVEYRRPDFVPLTAGDKDQNEDHYVENLQTNLAQKGYLTGGYISGTLDSLTLQAVNEICADNHWPMVGMEVSVELQSKIFTAPPKAAPTAKPEFISLTIDMRDQADETYISRMQTRLRELGYFDEDTPTEGVYDTVTAKAVKLFQEQNSLDASSGGNMISAVQLQNELFSKSLKRTKTISERFSETMLKKIDIFGHSIAVWIISAVIVTLIFLIIVVLILIGHKNKKTMYIPDGHSDMKPEGGGRAAPRPGDDSETEFTGNRPAAPANNEPAAFGEPTAVSPSAFPFANADFPTKHTDENEDASSTPSEDAPTIGTEEFKPMLQRRNINFTITFNGRTTTRDMVLAEPIIIGRKSSKCNLPLDPLDQSLSRAHCQIYLSGEQVMVSNLSNMNPTKLNDTILTSSMNSASEDAPTVTVDSFSPNSSEAVLHSGDILTVGLHTIVVRF